MIKLTSLLPNLSLDIPLSISVWWMLRPKKIFVCHNMEKSRVGCLFFLNTHMVHDTVLLTFFLIKIDKIMKIMGRSGELQFFSQ